MSGCLCARVGGPAGRARGIALVLVLWVIALLTVMALGLTAAQRTESTLTANALDGARFRAAADAGIAYAVLNLLAPPALDLNAPQAPGLAQAVTGNAAGQPQEWLPDGSLRPWTFAEVPLAISVSNEASRIDLNRADANTLTALLMVLEVPEDQAAALADRILDWRDEDDLSGLNGAEDPDYAAEGLPYGAKDGPFTSVEEVRQVLGVTPDLYARLAPELTVDSGADQVDQQFASAAVLAAVQGIALLDAQAAVAERAQPVPGAVPGGAAAASGRGGPVYRIRVARAAAIPDPDAPPAQPAAGADAAPAGAAGLAMEALVRVEQGGKPPFKVVWRRYGLAPPPPPPPPDAAGGLWR